MWRCWEKQIQSSVQNVRQQPHETSEKERIFPKQKILVWCDATRWEALTVVLRCRSCPGRGKGVGEAARLAKVFHGFGPEIKAIFKYEIHQKFVISKCLCMVCMSIYLFILILVKRGDSNDR